MPHRVEFRLFRYAFVAPLALAAAAIFCASAYGQGRGAQDADRLSLPDTTAPLDGIRREIDPDSQPDPFVGDRAAEDDSDERRRARRNSGRDGDTEALDGTTDGARADGDKAGDDVQRSEAARALRGAEQPDQAVLPVPDAELADTDGKPPPELDPYAPVGVRLGSFLIFPEVLVETVFTDNALLSTTNPQSDHALSISPGFRFESNWSRHRLEGSVGGTRSWYSEFPVIDEKEFEVAVLGRLDITRRTNFQSTFSHVLGQEDIDAADTPAGAAERTRSRVTGGTGQLSHRFNRVTASLRGGVFQEDYDDVLLATGAIANNDDRDLTEKSLTGRISYEFQPGVAGFVEGSGNNRDFDDPVDDNGIYRGSDGYAVQAGVSLDFGGKLTGEFAAGFARQTPDEVNFEDISGLIFNAGLEWRMTGQTTWRLVAESTIDETTLDDSPGSLNRSATVSVEHAFRRNIIAGVSLGFEQDDYAQSGQVDRDVIAGVNGEYLLSRSAALVASYEHTRSTSSVPDSDTTDNEVRLGVRLRR